MHPDLLESVSPMKEYITHRFDFSPSLTPARSASLVFQEPTNADPEHLPLVQTDPYQHQNCFFMLQWHQNAQQRQLWIRSSQEEDWLLIKMNHFPLKTLIAEGNLFLLGFRELFRIDIKDPSRLRRFELESAEVIDWLTIINEHTELEINVVYFDTHKGYFSKTYTDSTRPTFWHKIISYIKPYYRKQDPLQLLRIVIPNRFGLALHEGHLSVFNLCTMKLAEGKSIAMNESLGATGQLMLRWMFISPPKGFDDCLEVYVGGGHLIEVFTVNIVRNQFKLKLPVETDSPQRVELDQLHGEGVINWNKVEVLHKYQIELEGNLSTLEIADQTLIYRCFQTGDTLIPVVNLMVKENLTTKIVSRQMDWWREYYFGEELNREGTKGVRQSGKKELSQKKMNRVLLWKKKEAFIGFQRVNNSIYFIRASNVGQLNPIGHLQFDLESYSEKQMRVDESSMVDFTFLHFYRKRMPSLTSKEQKQYHRNLTLSLKKSIESLFPSHRSLSKKNQVPLNFSTVHLGSKLKDKLCFSSRFWRYMESHFEIDDPTIKERLILNVLACLCQASESEGLSEQFNGQDLVEAYCRAIRQELTGDTTIDLSIFLSRVFENLLPDCYVAKERTAHGRNRFIDWLVASLLSLEGRDTDELWGFMKKLVGCFNHIPLKTFVSMLSRNSSLFSVYLLSHPPPEHATPIFEALVTSPEELVMKQLRKIKHLISNQLESLFEIQCKITNTSVLNKTLELLDSKMEGSLVNTSRTKAIKGSLPQEILLYSNQESFDRNYNAIKQLITSWNGKTDSQVLSLIDRIQPHYQQQLSLDILHQNYPHVLQLEETILVSHTSLFNELAARSRTNDSQTLMGKLLEVIQMSFQTYHKYYRQYYHITKRSHNHHDFFAQISSSIQEEEALMTSSHLPNHIRLLSLILSTSSIALAHILLPRPAMPFTLTEIATTVMETLLKQQSLKHKEINLLYYLLRKLGEETFKKVVHSCESTNLPAITHKLQEKRIYGGLSKILLNSPQTASQYLNPFS